jgi:hypothetical protein
MGSIMLRHRPGVCLTVAAALVCLVASASARDAKRDALWAAVRAGDVKAVAAALDGGSDVNARNEIGVSALWIAAGKDKLDVIELLVRRGADVNARDGIWYQTPLSASVGGRHLAAAKLLLKAGAKDVDAALFTAAGQGNEEMVQMFINHAKVSQDALDAALYAATTAKKEKLGQTLRRAGAKPLPIAAEKDRTAWQKLVGTYESDGGAKMALTLEEHGLVHGGRWLKPTGPDTFVPLGSEGVHVRIERRGGEVARITMSRFTAEYSFYRFRKPVERRTARPEIGGESGPPLNWPSFRGKDGTGVADGQQPPVTWDLKGGKNIRWKTPIPGLGHSCPVVWGNRVFVTTAVSRNPDPKIRIGNYGDVASVHHRRLPSELERHRPCWPTRGMEGAGSKGDGDRCRHLHRRAGCGHRRGPAWRANPAWQRQRRAASNPAHETARSSGHCGAACTVRYLRARPGWRVSSPPGSSSRCHCGNCCALRSRHRLSPARE